MKRRFILPIHSFKFLHKTSFNSFDLIDTIPPSRTFASIPSNFAYAHKVGLLSLPLEQAMIILNFLLLEIFSKSDFIFFIFFNKPYIITSSAIIKCLWRKSY